MESMTCAGKKISTGPSHGVAVAARDVLHGFPNIILPAPAKVVGGTPLRKTMSDPMGFGELKELDRTLDEDMMMSSAVLDGALDAIYSKFDLGNPDDLASLYGVSPGAPDVRDVRVPAQTGTGTGSGNGSGDSNPKIDGKDRQAETTSKAVGKRGRTLNQAEVQRRYRERKKNRLLDLEKQVEDLREKVKELERENARRGDGSDVKEAFGSGNSTPPDAATTTEGERSSDDDTTTLPLPFAVAPADGDPEFTERVLREDAARRSRDSKGPKSDSADCSGCEGHLTFIIEASEALKRGVDGPSATGKFKNYTEAEIWWGGVTEVYNKAVRNIRDLVDVGASDSNLRGAIDAISNVVSVARESRSELAVISTVTRTVSMMEKDLASKGVDLRAACRTSCALLAKSVVDASMQSQNTEEVLTKLQNELPPKDLKIIVGWFESYMEEFLKIGKVRHDTIAKYERTKLTADEPHTVYGIPASEVTKEEGPYAEDSRMIMDSLRKEMLMYNDGIQDLLQQLPVRSAAQLYLSAFPSAPDPLSLALELKKKLRPESKATSE